MTPDVVLVPTYNRPELLHLCLEALAACPGIEDKIIHVRHDNHNGAAARADVAVGVVNRFRPKLSIDFATSIAHSYHGNTFNVMEGYRAAYETGARQVFLIEDDVLVCNDFFRWHAGVHANHKLMCSVGWHCLRRGPEIPRGDEDPLPYFLSKADYASVGVCWQREMLEHLLAHATTFYYKNLTGYLKEHFPSNRFGDCFTEQDGLIMRLLDIVKAPVAWPYRRRCHHVGIYGYHRPSGYRPGQAAGTGTNRLETAIEETRGIINDPVRMEKVGNKFGGDTDCISEARSWVDGELKLVAEYA